MKHLFTLSTLLLGLPLVLTAATPSGTALLEAIDTQRNFSANDLSATMTLVKSDPKEGTEQSVIRQFRRDRDDKFVFLFLEPSLKKGQGYLRIDDNLWLYDPESRKFSHESMKERFSGSDARNSDFGVSRLANDYEIVSTQAGTLGKHTVQILELKARTSEVTYARQKLWVTQDQYLVLKAEDYSETGRLLRTSLYPNYSKVSGHYLPSRMIFTDELVKGKQTVITLSDISLDRLPDTIFSKAYLESVNR